MSKATELPIWRVKVQYFSQNGNEFIVRAKDMQAAIDDVCDGVIKLAEETFECTVEQLKLDKEHFVIVEDGKPTRIIDEGNPVKEDE